MAGKKASFFSVIGADIKDRLQGNKSRANARLGLVNPPEGKSKLIWIRAGASRDSVLLAAGLMAAIRHKRLDVRLVLTYEEEYRDIIVEQLSGLEKIGFGFACANSTSTELRMLKRLEPFAVIFAGNPAGEGIIEALEKHPVKHILNFQTSDVENLSVEASYHNANNNQAGHTSFEAMTLLMQAQVDAQLGALLKGSKDRHLFLLSATGLTEDLSGLLAAWKKSALSNSSILCVYIAHSHNELAGVIEQQNLTAKMFSTWDREAPAENEIFVIDEWRWFAATAASATAIHLAQVSDETFWQSLASATVLSVDDSVLPPIELNLPRHSSSNVIPYWESLLDNAFQCRKLGDENRRQFWEQRRQAQIQIDELLQRVYDW